MVDIRLTVNVVVFSIYHGALSVLMVKREYPFGEHWGLMETEISPLDTTLEQAAKRKFTSLTGVSPPYLEQVQTLGDARRDPRGWSVSIVYYSLISESEIKAEWDSALLKWLSLDEARSKALAMDDLEIIENALQRLQNKSLYTSVPIFLLPQEFSLTDLQRTYELILGFKMEKKSFRRRLLEAHFLEKTGNVRRAKHRPAQLYRLSSKEPYFFPRIIEGARENKLSNS